MLPNFIVIGAMKAGTTSLADQLGSHPEVFMTTPKEPNFFGSIDDENWPKGVSWYEELFAAAGPAKARGEASPVYTMAPRVQGVPKRIESVVPDARLIYLIRNPIERIRSMYIHYLSRGQILSMSDALEQNPAYLDITRYAFQLERYLEHFPREQILVVSSEQLRTERERTLRDILEFIDVTADVDDIARRPERNRSIDRSVPTRTYNALHRRLARTRLRSMLSTPVRRRARRLLSRRAAPEHFAVPPDLEAEIWAALQDDLVRLRELVGPEMDLWGRA